MPGNCSYCHLPGHNITQCQHPNIDSQYNRLKMLYLNTSRMYGIGSIYASNRFVDDACRRFCARDLKAITAKYIGVSMRFQKKRLLQEIWYYFYMELIIVPPLEESLPTVPDEIPSYAQDLVDFIDFIDESVVEESVVEESVVEESVVEESIVDESGVAEVSLRTPNFHQIPSTRPRPLPYGYVYPDDEFIDEFIDEFMDLIHRKLVPRNLVPRNLSQEFDRAALKKYHISPSILVTETAEELEKCEDCSICYETTKLVDTVTINCGHKFCGLCVKRTLETHTNTHNSPSCALCRVTMINFVAKNPDTYNLVVEHCIL